MKGSGPKNARGGALEARLEEDGRSHSSADVRPAAPPRLEGACYGEANGARVVVLVDPTNLRCVEIAIRTRGENPQSIALPPEDAGRLLRALCLAVVDLGRADQLIREILELESRPSGTATTH